ncbi:uncharacterized protein [Rutidosis leptorrhynchoides]|uniref:uncharacterized protein n=1 Tax=Rutidosis leptorrhynchoides TaxID=125765 RepID=UPI003A998A44
MDNIKNTVRKQKPGNSRLRSTFTSCAVKIATSENKVASSKSSGIGQKNSNPKINQHQPTQSVNKEGVRVYGCKLGLKWKKKSSSQGFGYRSRDDKFGWVRRLISKEKPSFVALQETKMGSVDRQWIGRLWGLYDCDFIQREKIGKVGGQLLIWDSNLFEAETVVRCDFVIGIKGVWKNSGCNINIANIYGPRDDVNKQKLWSTLYNLISASDEEWVLCGDFNEVRDQSERFNCDFIGYRVDRFNKFISDSRLMKIPLGGRNFTRKDLTVVALDRDLSEHCPIMLKDEERNFGPKPFKIFDVWLDEEDVGDVIREAWNVVVPNINRKVCVFRNKLKNVKDALRTWSQNKYNHLDGEIELLKITSQQLELQAETRVLSDSELEMWRNSRKEWIEKERIKINMLKQKARVKWILDGDEKIKYFHSAIRRRNNSNTIQGLSINGIWNDCPKDIKEETYKHFKRIFEEVGFDRPSIEDLVYPTISNDKALALEATFDEKEIHEAILDCGSTKAP